MNKKGMSWSVIVTAIIALIVLLFVIFIFKEQIGELFKNFLNIVKMTTSGSEEFSKSIGDLT